MAGQLQNSRKHGSYSFYVNSDDARYLWIGPSATQGYTTDQYRDVIMATNSWPGSLPCQPGIDAIESKHKAKDNHLAMTQSAPMALRVVFKSLFASLFLDSVYFWTVLPYFRSSFKQQRIIRRRAISVDIPRMYDLMTNIMYYIPILMAFRVF